MCIPENSTPDTAESVNADVDKTEDFERALTLAIEATEDGGDTVVADEVDDVFGAGFTQFTLDRLPGPLALSFLTGAFAAIVNAREAE